MRAIVLKLILLFLMPLFTVAQENKWQQQVDYVIEVELNDTAKSLTGFVKMNYYNNSPDTLYYIWFHVWPNAYKNDRTAFSDQMLQLRDTRFYFAAEEKRGYINQLNFQVNGMAATLTDHPQHIDIVRLDLPEALAPGKQAAISTPFHIKLPYQFSRSGYDGDNFAITQWYPKPAVYDVDGWHPMPYLQIGEYFSEFGNYDVKIKIPQNYAVASTGQLQNEEEIEWLATRAGYTWSPLKQKIKKAGTVKTIVQKFPITSSQWKVLHFKQENVHDFAWFADKRYIVKQQSVLLASGKTVTAQVFMLHETEEWKKAPGFLKDALLYRSKVLGDYPYKTAVIVQGGSVGEGMEYPGIAQVGDQSNDQLLDLVIEHEVGHNWFQSALANNERKYPWLDEGLNTYYGNRYMKDKYTKEETKGLIGNIGINALEGLMHRQLVAINKDQQINLPTDSLTVENYALNAYYKTSEWLLEVEERVGMETLDKAMQQFYKEFGNKHISPEDLHHYLEAAIGSENIAAVMNELNKKGSFKSLSGVRFATTLYPPGYIRYFQQPSKTLISLTPAIGFNKYDGVQPGFILTNYSVPSSRFQFLANPLYATKTKKINGNVGINYSVYPKSNWLYRVKAGVTAGKYTYRTFQPDNHPQYELDMYRLVPSLKFEFKENSVFSTVKKFIELKSFIINERNYQGRLDTLIVPGSDTTIGTVFNFMRRQQVYNRLTVGIENSRILYPWSANLGVEQSRNFVKLSFTGTYFLNYAKGGGLAIRAFAGKIWNTGEGYLERRYQLNLSGENGAEDYTYSHYYMGRNESSGFYSQQMSVRDGGFKVNTPLLSNKVGKSDDWLLAVNLSTTIPDNVNPLRVLPVKIPLKIFADIGTYSAPWKRNATAERFLYDAGLQLSLFGDVVNVYLPVFYSSVFKDYYHSMIPAKKDRWKQTIRFTIDFDGLYKRTTRQYF